MSLASPISSDVIERDLMSDAFLPPASNDMPLLTLVWLKDDHEEADARNIVGKMLKLSSGPYGTTAKMGGDRKLAWGILLPARFTPLTCWSSYSNGSELCLIEGDIYDDLPEVKILPGENPKLAARVAAAMREHPDRRLRDIVGIYSGVYVDQVRSCVYAFGDLTGTRRVYWLSDKKRFVVTGNLWAFRGCDGVESQCDKMALTQMLAFGFPMAARTWIAGVKHLQRGRQVRSFADGRTEVRMLLDPVVRESWSIKQSVDALRGNLDETVRRIWRRLDRPVALGLSGGLDSRTLLASLHFQKIDHCSFTFCLDPEEADNRLAKSSTRLLGEPHETVVLDSHSPALGALHRDIRLINEGESSGFAHLLLAACAQRYSNAIFIGNEAVRETSGSFQPLSMKSKRDLAQHMLREYLTRFHSDQIAKLLAPALRVSWQDVLDEWFDSFEQIQQESILDVFLDHVADYRVQRRTRPRLEQARFFCLPVYPYMDERLYSIYRRLPLSHVHAERAPLALLSSYNSGLENLPSPAFPFDIPIYQSYQYRHFLHLGRVVRARFLWSLQKKWQESKGEWGFGQSALNAMTSTELRNLQHCRLFHWPEVQALIEKAARGAFVNKPALHSLISAGVVNDFLFGPGFSGDRALRLLESSRDLHFVYSKG
jgi:Asparagine synthase